MKCAFAVNSEHIFSDQHFGEAENFMIYSCYYFGKSASKSNCNSAKTHKTGLKMSTATKTATICCFE